MHWMTFAGALAQVAILRGDVRNAVFLDEIEPFVFATRQRQFVAA